MLGRGPDETASAVEVVEASSSERAIGVCAALDDPSAGGSYVCSEFSDGTPAKG